MEEKIQGEYHVDINEVFKDLEKQGFEIEGKEKEVAPVEKKQEQAPLQKEEVPKEDEIKVEEKPTKEEVKETPVVDDTLVDRVSKEPALIPVWKVKKMEKEFAREKEELQKQIETFQKNPTRENNERIAEHAENIRELAETYGLELDDNQEKFFNALLSTATKKAIPHDLLQNMQSLQQQKQVEYLEQQFETEFSSLRSLVKERFGDIPESEAAILRNKLHDLAFTEQYAKVPLKKIFLAEVEDMGITPAKQNIVSDKSGKMRGTEIDFSRVTDEDIRQMSDDVFEKFMEYKAGPRRNWV